MFWFLLLTWSVIQTFANPLNITVDQQASIGDCKFTEDCEKHKDCENIQVMITKTYFLIFWGTFRMQAANVILVNVSMMGIHSGNLEQSALNIKTVPAGYYLNREAAIS